MSSSYIIEKSTKPTFQQKGLRGFRLALPANEYELYLVEVQKGHDTYFISKKITHTYYVLRGKGNFDINSKKMNVKTGMVVSIPPGVEYTYSGKMKMVLIMNPPWFKGNEKITKPNPAVE